MSYILTLLNPQGQGHVILNDQQICSSHTVVRPKKNMWVYYHPTDPNF